MACFSSSPALIIDLATGDQPMHSSDGRYVVVFNGEIYNFRELRKELSSCAARFNTHSDTEVILEGYRRWGSDVVDRLHGMFAFVIWDRLRDTVFAARDRLGIKPLCWSMQRGSLIFSSTLGAHPYSAALRRKFRPDRAPRSHDLRLHPAPRTTYRESRSWSRAVALNGR